jgi:hypothetical protein
MGYRGKIEERERARTLRAESWTLLEIATELGVAKSSVSLWTRDVDFVPRPGNRGHSSHKPHPLKVKKQRELERCRADADQLISTLSQRDLTMFCLGLYAGEGSKRDGTVSMANTNPTLIYALLYWLRTHFEIDESRLRCKIYLHDGLDIETATEFWRDLTDIPVQQFRAPYRAEADPTRRLTKHVNGCATVMYSCAHTHRQLLAMIEAVSSTFAIPG